MHVRIYSAVAASAIVAIGTFGYGPSLVMADVTGPAGGGLSHENRQPGLGINYLISTQGIFPSRNSGGTADITQLDANPFLGEITMFAGNFAPRGWAFTDGQLLSINSNQALFALLGTQYGGDGRTTFGLPDLRGRSAMHQGHGIGLTDRRIGSKVGVDDVTLTEAQMPSHNHVLSPPPFGNTNTFNTGGSQPHTNMAPSQAINFYVPLTGIFPSRNDATINDPVPNSGGDEFIGSVKMAGYNFAPRNSMQADGQLLDIASNTALFSILGTTYGGDGRTTFGIPDLQGRVVMHEGTGNGLTNRRLGEELGVEQVTLTESTMPSHNHPGDDPTLNTGGSQAHDNKQPSNTLNYIIAIQGLFPSRNSEIGDITTNSLDPFLGEIQLFAGNFAPRGWAFTDGQLLGINGNEALFSILGTTYGGDGRTTFALPDLRSRVPVHVGGSSGPGLDPWSLGMLRGQETVSLTLNQLPSHTHDYVPEPGTAVLGLAGVFGLVTRRSHRRG
jgi:microcystin-dependent protein